MSTNRKVKVLSLFNATYCNPNNLAATIQYWPAAASWRNRRRDLNVAVPPQCADNSLRKGSFQAFGITNDEYFVSNLNFVAVSQRQAGSLNT
jgi:hypothetical protein